MSSLLPCGTVVTSCSASQPHSVLRSHPPNLTSSLHLHNSSSSRPLRPRDRVASLPRVPTNRVDALRAIFKLAPSNIATCDSSSYVIVMSDGIAPAIDKGIHTMRVITMTLVLSSLVQLAGY